MRNKIIIFLVFLLAGCNANKSEHDHAKGEEYTCPMHPQIVQDKPGTCPVCGMDLVKKSGKGSEVAITEDLKNLVRPTNASVVAKIKTTRPERKSMSATSVASGIVTYDTRKTYAVPVRFSGRIEKLNVKYNFQAVTQGQVIMEVYSPEMLTAQRELLYVASEQKGDKELLESAKQKLLLLGLTQPQIEGIIASGKESFALPILSPYTGYIVESSISGNTIQQSTLGAGMQSSAGMNAKAGGSMNQVPQAANMNNSSGPNAGQQITIREGMYVAAGQSLFKVVDATRLWAEIYFPAMDANLIKKGSVLRLNVNGTDVATSSNVDFVQPFFSEGNQFLQVRSYLNVDKNKIRVGQLVTAEVDHPHKESLWVPREAVLDLGVQQIAFVKLNGTFTPFKVKTGAQSGNSIEITEGLEDSSEIAINAQYLVDSESFIIVNDRKSWKK